MAKIKIILINDFLHEDKILQSVTSKTLDLKSIKILYEQLVNLINTFNKNEKEKEKNYVDK